MAQLEVSARVGKAAERGPQATVRVPLANTQKKNLEMTLYADGDFYVTTRNHRKTVQNTSEKAKKRTTH